jgi:glycosyltransferase involved in cell wall biosynthesis
MNVLFIIKPEDFPSARIRVRNLLPILIKNQIEPVVEVIPRKYWRRRKLFASASQFSAVVLQKELVSIREILFLRKHAKSLIFDFDDAIYFDPVFTADNIDAKRCPKTLDRFTSIINSVDKVIVANDILLKQTRSINPNIPIQIIPSAVETDIVVKDDYQLSSPPIIGWVGLEINLRFVKNFAPAFLKLAEEMEIRLRIISSSSIDIPGINVEFKEWDLRTQYAEIAKFDIGIMPLTSNPCTEGKSAYKLLQYMAAGVPALASAVGVNKNIGGNDDFCLLANDVASFAEKLKLLLNDEQLRKNLGLKGRELVKDHYSIEVIGEKLADFLKSCI